MSQAEAIEGQEPLDVIQLGEPDVAPDAPVDPFDLPEPVAADPFDLPEPVAVAAPEPVAAPVAAAADPFDLPEPVAAPVAVAVAADAAPAPAVAAVAAVAPVVAEIPEDADPLHIGNLIGILSEAYGYTVGRVVYRDLAMVRIMPQEASDRAIEFPMSPDGASFIPELNVSTIEIIEYNPSNYYVDFLGARPGEVLEFFTVDGVEAAPMGEVVEIIKTASKDSIKLKDGRVLKFRGIGPQEPIAVIRVRTAINAPAAVQEGVAPEEREDAVARARRQTEMAALLRSVLPSATVEVIPTAERSYPDSMQREDMFQDLLASVSEKKRTNQRRIRTIEREVDILISLKNRSIYRSGAGNIVGASPYKIVTIQDALNASRNALPAAIPIVAAARVLNLDAVRDGNYNKNDVVPRSLKELEQRSQELAESYDKEERPKDQNWFYSYTQTLLGQDQATLQGPAGSEWPVDQDILRTAGPETPVQGLSAHLPSSPEDLDEDTTTAVSIAMLVTNVKERSIRVLTSDWHTHVKTGAEEMIAPSDPSKVTGYVILPAKAAMALRPPIRAGELQSALHYAKILSSDQPTVMETIRDLHTLDKGSPLHAWTLPAEEASTASVADWLSSVLQYVLHPIDSLAPRSPRIMALLDTLGLGSTDLTSSVADVLNDFIKASQKTWRTLLKTRRQEIQKILDAEGPRTYQSVTGSDATLWAALRASAPLKELLDDVSRRNPSISGAPTLIAASLLVEAQGDANPLVWSEIARLDGREALGDLDPVLAAASLANSRTYILRSKALKARDLLAISAPAPVKSTCVHADRLEAIRNMTDVLQRSRLLRDFIEEFQGPKSGDWMTCVICKENCVCYHELMELEALAQPSRMYTIQKQIMIKFGGGRQGKQIVCKNCSQSLQDIDYDDHVEFDDDGRPIASASVLTEEQMQDVGETSWRRAVTAAVQGTISNTATFATEGQQYLGDALTVILDRAGLQADADVIRRIVRYADLYVSLRSPPQGAYEAQRSRMLTAASTKIKVSTGIAGVTVDVPTYAAVLDQLRISALIALTALSIQVAQPAIVVNNPLPLCTFSRGGYPLVPSAKPEDVGALAYISCVVASIQRDMVPWRHMKWSGEPKLEPRKKEALKVGTVAMQVILGLDAKSAPLSFTPEIRQLLAKVQTDVVATKQRSLVSLTDEMPVGFRPEAFPLKMARPVLEQDPVPAIEAALVGGTGSRDLAGPIASALRQDAIAVIGGLHETAFVSVAAAIAAGRKPTVDETCCAVPFAELQRPVDHGSLTKAYNLLRSAVPSAPTGGTHLWPTYETPVPVPVDQSVEEGVFFKLFLKFCYQGPAVGEAHEFSTGSICRSCGLALGKPLDLIDFSKEGAGILAAQQGSLRIEVTPALFTSLSEAIRRRRVLQPAPTIRSKAPWRTGLEAMIAVIAQQGSESSLAFGTILEGVLAGIPDESGPVDEIGRATQWEALSVYAIGLRAEIGDKIGPLAARGAGKQEMARAREAQTAMTMFDTLTEDPFQEGPRALQEYWCAKVEAAGKSFGIKDVKRALWAKISPKHDMMMSKLVTDNAVWYGGTVTPKMQPILQMLAKEIGPLLRVWVQQVRPSATGSWTVAEAQLVLRTIVLQAWREALITSSWMYNEMAVPSERESVATGIADWTRSLMFHVKQQFSRFTKDTIKRILQNRAQLERETIVKEFEDLQDDDLRAAEMIKKNLRLGRWGQGANIRTLDADQFDFESEQRHRMGIVDAPVDPILLEGAAGPAQAEDFGLVDNQEEGSAYDTNQAAAGDDY